VGIIKNTSNKVIGQHNGTSFYTIGQRRGLGISLSRPAFIQKIDANSNELIVGLEEDLYTNDIIIRNVNYFTNQIPNKGLTGKIRYRSSEFEIESLEKIDNLLKVKFKEKQKSVTPGQYLVVYYGEYLVLGGEIT
jgi:tRNA-specific 2-thiouridylase